MICTCGQDVRLRAMRVSLNRKRGVHHWLEHSDGSKPCVVGEWACTALKPYPKNEADSEWKKMIARFEETVALARKEGA